MDFLEKSNHREEMNTTVAYTSGSERCAFLPWLCFCLLFIPCSSEEQKGSGLFFGSESEPRIDDGMCRKRDLTPFVQSLNPVPELAEGATFFRLLSPKGAK